MANVSNTRLRLRQLVKKFNVDKPNEILEIEFDDEKLKELHEAILDLSYECKGDHFGDDLYDLYGRWYYENNFHWEKETNALYDALERLGCEGLRAFYVDYDGGMQFVTYTELLISNRKAVHIHREQYNYLDFASKFNVAYKNEPDDENDEDFEQESRIEDAMLDYFDEWSEQDIID